MNSHLLRACALLIIAALPRYSYAADPGPSTEQLRKELGINAVLATNICVALQKRIEEGKPEAALELITAEYMRLLPQLRLYDADIANEPTVLELRDRVVKHLQTRWLAHPPTYLDAQSAEYLERTCATIPGCPKGRVHPLKELVLPPSE
jgi:hypothetical protein